MQGQTEYFWFKVNASISENFNFTIELHWPGPVIDNTTLVAIVVNGTADATPPVLTPRLPLGINYSSSTIPINVTINEDAHACWFSLNAGSYSNTIYTNYPCTMPHTVTFTADFYNSVVESNEANNQKSVFVDCIL